MRATVLLLLAALAAITLVALADEEESTTSATSETSTTSPAPASSSERPSPRGSGKRRKFRDLLQDIRKKSKGRWGRRRNKNPNEKSAGRERRKKRRHHRPTGDTIAAVNLKKKALDNLYQGDIVLTDEQAQELFDDLQTIPEEPAEAAAAATTRAKRQAKRAAFFKKWKTVYYDFATISDHAQVVSKLAFDFWGSHTCINFVRSSTATPRLNFVAADGCWSGIGQIESKPVQDLSMGEGCDHVGIAAHEIAHALGFFHEQSRWDRDKFISVYPNNMLDGWESQFDRQTDVMNDNMGFDYDYGGIMHYSASDTAQEGLIAVEATEPKYQDTMGSHIVSLRDVVEMNQLYCPGACDAATTTCLNGGIRNPRDCTKCICPSGFGGKSCNQRPEGCGATLTATATDKQLNITVGDGKEYDLFRFCTWHVVAPAGKRVQVRLVAYKDNQCQGGCVWGGVEFKWKRDMQLTGSRICCAEDADQTFTTDYNIMPVIGYNRYNKEQFTIAYKYV